MMGDMFRQGLPTVISTYMRMRERGGEGERRRERRECDRAMGCTYKPIFPNSLKEAKSPRSLSFMP